MSFNSCFILCLALTLYGRVLFAQNSNSNFDKEEIPNLEKPTLSNEQSESSETVENQEADQDGYKKGSICVYCKYCKLCKLCDTNCPSCKDDSNNCNMCKYCKYCRLCGAVCDTVCTPGSFIDTITSAVYDALPSFNEKTRKEMDEDLNKAKDFIKEYL
uniref:Sarcoplasmic reticulum histidine-rich calcium-binding protein n=1 Tax=Hydra vulgaris TaxID=6087 RepID=T2MGK3_HYDVU